VAYDVLRESVALIEAGRAEPVHRLSRRRRFAAMAVDMSGDMAVTMFARRGVGNIQQDTHVLVLRDGVWTLLGGGGGSADERLLADRPATLPSHISLLGRDFPASSDPRVIVTSGAGGTRDTRGQFEPSDGGRWISYFVIRVNAEVALVEAFHRSLSVPWHGHVVLVWCGDQPKRVAARNASGASLAELRVDDPR
jgi:hypothetical protein